MSEYRLLVDVDVLEFLRALRRRDQDSLLKRFSAIAGFPGKYRDYMEDDSVGRTICVHVFGRYAIKYWDDSADRQLKILDVHPADRSGESGGS